MKSREDNKKMSKDCKYFVQHAWKKDLCANCFESREEHLKRIAKTKPYVVKDVKNIQGILREHQRQEKKYKKKNNVKFPETLAEIIGYGGEQYSDSESDPSSNDVEIIDSMISKKKNGKDEVDRDKDWEQDSEEDRALNNLTRLNTNFNAVTENLTVSSTTSTTTATINNEIKKPLGSLMLGKINKDSEGKKTTLLISVTPFGADDTIPTAKRPVEKKRCDDKNIELEKIVDMPLIVPSTNTTTSTTIIKKTETNLTSLNNKIKTNEILSSVFTSESKDDKIIDNILKEDNNKITESNDMTFEDICNRTVEGESLSIDNNSETLSSTNIITDKNSREEAGVPDGEEDEKEKSISIETSSIISSTTTEPRYSFLHSETISKKSVFSTKPINEQKNNSKKIIDVFDETKNSPISSQTKTTTTTTTPTPTPTPDNNEFITSAIKDDNSTFESQSIGYSKRRMAPKPPEINCDDTNMPLFARKQNFKSYLKSDCPVVREKEKRERASSSYSPKLKKSMDTYQNTSDISNNNNNLINDNDYSVTSISRISGNISYSLPTVSTDELDNCFEEKKKSKSRFLPFKKLLRMGGSRKDLNLVSTKSFSTTKVDDITCGLSPKPRLEIIHPLELNGSAVEVLRHDKLVKFNDEIIHGDTKQDVNHNTTARLGKPPPPPRSTDTDSTNQINKESQSPNLDNMMKLQTSMRGWQHTSAVAGDSIYANLGEVRCGIAPSKPQRTSSLRRDNENSTIQSSPRSIKSSKDYTKFNLSEVPTNTNSLDPTTSECHDAYELLSSSPECDSNIELRRQTNVTPSRTNVTIKRNSELGICNVGHNLQYKYNKPMFVRSNSLPYYGSETESELSTPDGFYTGNEGAEEDHDWKCKNDEYSMAKIRQGRNRCVVYRSLEDNYGAVVVANHESLAQMLERLSQTDQLLPINLRNLNLSNVRLQNFIIDIDTVKIIGKRIFCFASWNKNSFTLCLSVDGLLSSVLSQKEFCLIPITEFIDKITNEIIPSNLLSPEMINTDVTVSILAPIEISTIKLFLSTLSKNHQDQQNNNNEFINRECYLILLQFINVLKNLQARGIEELPMSLNNFLLARDDKDTSYRLYHLQCLHTDHPCDDREEQISLCHSALVALKELNLIDKLPIVQHLLIRERAVSLSQVKAVLEYSLWGPSNVTMNIWKEREIVLQRWLDLERATILHALVRTRPQLTVTDEYQLIFLVNTTAKTMCEASILLDEQKKKYNNCNENNI
ncbi:uncharacterized protein LOC122852949 isoform X2 [Aphidius gifuensis]|uniref:uncharacterized protein LOC122852949 isoform X2 n=1 Tax=Aphidius gifuensis TaxID=684658 RepID=UPI001CDD4A0A|nr:uncharacterized protein LOC122852949 isoform X2 [Aphidius gifuensis]